ncbi:MAG TPA: pyridoxamine 5'-phosphate oxidase family protein [Candidatus Sulfomarinibacteraceae bacterium]|nr:pyridoxamine 5'-phosphate oxidase family protein [Candidatus Sulfomarinibacteraceae bacterium]
MSGIPEQRLQEPRADRPVMPADYGVPDHDENLLPWSHARERLQQSQNYWISTVRANGSPHATPIWAVWLDDKLYFDGSPETQRGKNLARDPRIVAHLESGSDVVIVEGEARPLSSPPRSLTERVAAAYRDKYADLGYAPQADQWDEGGLYEMQPRKALAWTSFPTNCTRWRFDGE